MKQFFTAMLLLAALCARAQQPETAASPSIEELSAQVEQLAGEVNALKAKEAKREKLLANLPKISGYVQVGYTYASGERGESSFFVKRARVDMKGDILKEKLDYRLQVDFASKPKIVDVFVQYKPFRQLNLKVGQYKVPFSIESTGYSPLKLEMIDYSLAIRKLMNYSDVVGLSASGRDMGASLYGSFWRCGGRDILSYDLGIFNGEGINTKDGNKSKDFAGRLMLRPAKGLLLSGSYYTGEYGADHLDRTRYAVGGEYDCGRIILRSEYIAGTTEALNGEGARGEFDSDGWYATLGWRATKTLMPALRYESFTGNTAARSATRQQNWQVGLNWQPVKHLRCQLNYTYEACGSMIGADRNVVTVLFTGIF